MPDRGLGQGFLQTVQSLLERADVPTEYDLRRAVSACYYAVFHSLAGACADALVGADKSTRSKHAWIEVYRGLEHGRCYAACEASKNIPFPEPLKQFAQEFMQLRNARERADYDPTSTMSRIYVEWSVATAQGCMSALRETSQKDMVAFASFLLITSKGALDARAKAKAERQTAKA